MRISTLATSSLLIGFIAAAGCTSNKHGTWGYIKGNLTPELAGTSETKLDKERNTAVVNNSDWRQVSDDWGRFWLTDSPNTLSPYPIVNTSGTPQ